MIDFKMIDLDGRWRHITIPVERFTEDIFTYGIGFDGSNYGYAPVEKSDMVDMADKTMIMKYVIRNAAVQEGKTATLMPKPIYGEAGNGMHVHMLLKKDGQPIFYDKDGYSGLSETAHYFIGGLLKHVASLCAFTNPSTNSFKRLVPGFEAPVTIGYATSNRSAVIRIPAYAKSPETKRFELRNPDATANPYYAYAAILMAGLDGIRNRIDPREHGWGTSDRNLAQTKKSGESGDFTDPASGRI